MTTISTARIDLVAQTLSLVDAELQSNATLGMLLRARVPDGWPPGEYDRNAIVQFQICLSEHPESSGWYGWYAVLREEEVEGRTLIGAAGFLGPPAADGTVEIGYSVLPEYEGRGVATEIVQALIEHAFASGRVRRITAHTTEGNSGSVRVLVKAGFGRSGAVMEGGVVQFVLDGPQRHASPEFVRR